MGKGSAGDGDGRASGGNHRVQVFRCFGSHSVRGHGSRPDERMAPTAEHDRSGPDTEMATAPVARSEPS